jgi:hypothetical protein
MSENSSEVLKQNSSEVLKQNSEVLKQNFFPW